MFTFKFELLRAVSFSHCNSGPEEEILVEILAQINKPFAVVYCQLCNQSGLFIRKVKSGTCISSTRDPATERIENSIFCFVWSPASKRFVVCCSYQLQSNFGKQCVFSFGSCDWPVT